MHKSNMILSEDESEAEEERAAQGELLGSSERRKRIAQLQAKLLGAAAVGAVRVKRRKLHRETNIGEGRFLAYVLLPSAGCWIWNLFLQRLMHIDSCISEACGYGRSPSHYGNRPFVVCHGMARGSLRGDILLVGLGYGAHWAIVPATVSELFGLKSFGALYNFLTLVMAVGSLIFSGVIASGIYDYEAEEQAALQQQNLNILIQTFLCAPFFLSSVVRSSIMDALDSVVDPPRDFAKDSVRLVKRCDKPDRKGFFISRFISFQAVETQSDTQSLSYCRPLEFLEIWSFCCCCNVGC
ncbi:transport protein Sec61 subunit gamma-2-like protein [Drosera capensis]